jgi:hypothetical protein
VSDIGTLKDFFLKQHPTAYDLIDARMALDRVETNIQELCADAFTAGYAARDKLSCVNCGDGGKPLDEKD